MGDPDVKDLFVKAFVALYKDDVLSVLRSKDDQRMHVINLNFMQLLDDYQVLCENLLCNPARHLPIANLALIAAQRTVLDGLKDDERKDASVKIRCRVQIIGLPECPELHRVTIPHTRDAGLFICLTGTVIRTTQPKMLEYRRNYQCAKCRYTFAVEADYEQFYVLQPPLRCTGPDGCSNSSFTPCGKADPDNYKDFQEIKLQEHVQKLSLGSIPRSIWVTVEDDLVDVCKPGDDVRISGIVQQRWRTLSRGQRSDIELVIKSNHIQVNNDQRAAALVTEELKREFCQFWSRYRAEPLVGRNHILASLCPQIYGLYAVKLAVALVLCGGVQRIDPNGSRVRGEPHLLLVGDPGCGKSQFLKYSAKLCPRSVLTTGIGSTSAGLTVTAVKDSGEWQLEAGALVLADGGICCIDEFNSIKEADRAAIHEAMEQQTISVAKAGLVCKLDTRCSVLAATNPRGSYDATQSLSVNVAIASPLLSRFDLVMVLLDRKDDEWDRLISSYILDGKDPVGGGATQGLWPMEKLQAYISYVRQIKPQMTDAANEILVAYYRYQRRGESGSSGRTTVRMLESLIRLCQAHARLSMRTEVTVCDAVTVISLFEVSAQGASLLDGRCPLQAAFPGDPMAEYWRSAQSVLAKLNLKEIWEEEKQRLIDEYEISPMAVEENPNDLPERPSHKALQKAEKLLQNIHQRRAIEQTQVCQNRKKKKNFFGKGQKRKRPVEVESSSSEEEERPPSVLELSLDSLLKETENGGEEQEKSVKEDETAKSSAVFSDDEDFVPQTSFVSRFRKVFNMAKKRKLDTGRNGGKIASPSIEIQGKNPSEESDNKSAKGISARGNKQLSEIETGDERRLDDGPGSSMRSVTERGDFSKESENERTLVSSPGKNDNVQKCESPGTSLGGDLEQIACQTIGMLDDAGVVKVLDSTLSPPKAKNGERTRDAGDFGKHKEPASRHKTELGFDGKRKSSELEKAAENRTEVPSAKKASRLKTLLKLSGFRRVENDDEPSVNEESFTTDADTSILDATRLSRHQEWDKALGQDDSTSRSEPKPDSIKANDTRADGPEDSDDGNPGVCDVKQGKTHPDEGAVGQGSRENVLSKPTCLDPLGNQPEDTPLKNVNATKSPGPLVSRLARRLGKGSRSEHRSLAIPGPAGSPGVRIAPRRLESRLSFISKLRNRESNDSGFMDSSRFDVESPRSKSTLGTSVGSRALPLNRVDGLREIPAEGSSKASVGSPLAKKTSLSSLVVNQTVSSPLKRVVDDSKAPDSLVGSSKFPLKNQLNSSNLRGSFLNKLLKNKSQNVGPVPIDTATGNVDSRSNQNRDDHGRITESDKSTSRLHSIIETASKRGETVEMTCSNPQTVIGAAAPHHPVRKHPETPFSHTPQISDCEKKVDASNAATKPRFIFRFRESILKKGVVSPPQVESSPLCKMAEKQSENYETAHYSNRAKEKQELEVYPSERSLSVSESPGRVEQSSRLNVPQLAQKAQSTESSMAFEEDLDFDTLISDLDF